MKIRLILLFILGNVLKAQAQTVRKIDTVRYPETVIAEKSLHQFNTDFKYTLFLKGFGIEQFAPMLDKGNDDTYYQTYFNQFGLMINNYQLSYRFAVQHREGNSTISKACNGCQPIVGNLQSTHLRIGFQKHFNYARFQPYLGADVGYLYQKYKGNTQQTLVTTADVFPVRFDDVQHAGTLSPFIGFKIYVSRKLSFYAESTAHLALARHKTDIFGDAEREGNPYRVKDNRFSPYFAPLSVGLQYHFGYLQY